jgi:DNA-binding NarL/FixJ family response regulator
MSIIRALLVDDYADFIESASQFLSTVPEIKVVGRASSGEEALQTVGRLHPDLVLMDLAMPGMSGLEATRRIKAQTGAPRVVIITLYSNRGYRVAALAAGADGFMSKAEFGEDLVPLLRDLFGGQGWSQIVS